MQLKTFEQPTYIGLFHSQLRINYQAIHHIISCKIISTGTATDSSL